MCVCFGFTVSRYTVKPQWKNWRTLEVLDGKCILTDALRLGHQNCFMSEESIEGFVGASITVVLVFFKIFSRFCSGQAKIAIIII